MISKVIFFMPLLIRFKDKLKQGWVGKITVFNNEKIS